MRTTLTRVWGRTLLALALVVGSGLATAPAALAQTSAVTPPTKVPSRYLYPTVCLASNLRLKKTAEITRTQCAIVKARIDSLNRALAIVRNTVILEPVLAGTTTSSVQRRIAISRAAGRVRVGATLQLTATVKTDRGATVAPQPTVTWSAAPVGIVTVSSTGLVRGLKAGAVVVTAQTTTAPLATRNSNIVVFADAFVPPPAPAPAVITITPQGPSLLVGTTQQLTGVVTTADGTVIPPLSAPITWTSSAPSVATVSTTGLVAAKAAGASTITAATAGYPSATRTTTVTVTALPTVTVPHMVLIAPTTASVLVGATQQFTGTVLDSAGATISPAPTVTWASSAPSVATINATTGLATGVTAGTVTITGSTPNWPVATRVASLTVTAPPPPDTQPTPPPPPTPVLATIVVSPTSKSLLATETQQFTAQGYDQRGALFSFTPTWSVTAGGGTISSSGLFTAGATPGTYANTVRASSGLISGVASITVNAAPPPSSVLTAIRLTPTSTVLAQGAAQQFTAIGYDQFDSPMALTPTWSVVAGGGTVSSSGLFLAGTTAGTFANTVKAASGSVSGTATVTVSAPPPPPPPTTAVLAELPRTTPSTTFPAPARIVQVAGGANLQTAIDNASCGDELRLAVGATYIGNYTLPNKACTDAAWVTIRTNLTDAQIGQPGTRMTPSRAAALGLAKILSASTINESLLQTDFSANHYRFVGVELGITGAVTTLNAIIRFGSAENTQTTANTAHHLVLDRVYLHGTATASVSRCLALNSGTSVVIDSWFAHCHGNSGDSQAIIGWNGPGPFLIQNNYLEAGHEVVAFGGGTFTVTNGAPSDITIRGNHMTRPLSWHFGARDGSGNPVYSAGQWQVKNLFESKNSKRVLLEGNVMENAWEDAQDGMAVVLKSENQNSDNPWTQTADMTIRYNVIRCVGSVFSFAGKYSDTDSRVSVYSARFTVHDNVVTNVNTGVCTGAGIATRALNGLNDLAEFHNTINNNGDYSAQALLFDGNPQTRLAWHSNALYNGEYGVFGSGGTGSGALVKFAPGALFAYNLLVGGNCSILPATTLCPTTMPATPGLGYDGVRIGADIPFVTALTANVVVPDTAPTVGIAVLPGASIQAAVDANPAGSTFLLKAGTHVRQDVRPKDGDVFRGEAGTIMDGQGATQFAFRGYNGSRWINDVRIIGVVMTNYTPPAQNGAIWGGDDATNSTARWVLDSVEVSYSTNLGIRIGNRMQVLRSKAHHNGSINIGGVGRAVLVDGLVSTFGNNGCVKDPGFESGGSKFVMTDSLVVRNSTFSNNCGVGLWLDINNINGVLENNIVEDNVREGIAIEVSYKTTIRNNSVNRNGWPTDPFRPNGWLWDAGIGVHASSDVEIYGNTLSENFNGIVAIQQPRNASTGDNYGAGGTYNGPSGGYIVTNLYAHDNTVSCRTFGGPNGGDGTVCAGAATDIVGGDALFTSRNNRWVNNTYTIGSNPGPFAWMNGYRTCTAWKGYGQDTAGTCNP